MIAKRYNIPVWFTYSGKIGDCFNTAIEIKSLNLNRDLLYTRRYVAVIRGI